MTTLRDRLQQLLEKDTGIKPVDVLEVLREHGKYRMEGCVPSPGEKGQLIYDLLGSLIEYIEDDELPHLWWLGRHNDEGEVSPMTVEYSIAPSSEGASRLYFRPYNRKNVCVSFDYLDGDLVLVIGREDEVNSDGQVRVKENRTVIDSIVNCKGLILP